MLLPPSLQDWLPQGHLAHFVVERVALLPLGGFQVNTRGTASAQMSPAMMLSLLIYNYAIGRMAEQADREARPEPLKVPEEIARRETRLVKLKQAQAVIEARHTARMAEKPREYEAKTAERDARRARGETVRGRDFQPLEKIAPPFPRFGIPAPLNMAAVRANVFS